MIIISYDIANDKKRNQFYKYLKKFGRRLQYSVFQINNSERILEIIKHDIVNKFKKEFDDSDSVYIFKIDESKIDRYGYAENETKEYIIVK